MTSSVSPILISIREPQSECVVHKYVYYPYSLSIASKTSPKSLESQRTRPTKIREGATTIAVGDGSYDVAHREAQCGGRYRSGIARHSSDCWGASRSDLMEIGMLESPDVLLTILAL